MTSISFPTSDIDSEDANAKINDLKKMVYNFKMQRSEILLRIGTIYRKNEEDEAMKYESSKPDNKRKLSSTMQSSSDESPKKFRARSYKELEEVLKNLGKVKHVAEANNLIDIIFYCSGVKLYYIENNGEVVSSLEDFVLRIIRLGRDFERNLDETIFLQLIKHSNSTIDVGVEIKEDHPTTSSNRNDSSEVQSPDDLSFIYPLIQGVSPCFRTKFGAFILPDLHSNDGSAIGLLIPKEFDDLVLDILVTILKGVVAEDGTVEFGDFTKIGEPSRIKRSTTGDVISENIVYGASWLSQGFVKTAEKTGQLIDFSTPYIISKIQKAPEDTPPVSEKVQTSVTVAKSLSGYAAQGTSFVAEKVGGAMTCFGKFLAPHVQRQGSRLLNVAGMESSLAEETMIETLKIASGASDAISTIYSGLESSAGILGRNIADNTVKVVSHKYGEPMGQLSKSSFDTVGNLINVNRNFNIITPKGLIKSSAKGAGRGILQAEEFKPKVYLNKDYFSGNLSLYPSLDNFAREISKRE